ncbi:MAG: hypothetical protein R3C10_05545 [Pirellulales bacterium]
MFDWDGGVPDFGLNGDPPPFWIWVVGFALLILIVIAVQSCA